MVEKKITSQQIRTIKRTEEVDQNGLRLSIQENRASKVAKTVRKTAMVRTLEEEKENKKMWKTKNQIRK